MDTAAAKKSWPEVDWRVRKEDATFVEGRMVTMPCCGFSFGDDYTDGPHGDNANMYTCPLCEPAALEALEEAQAERESFIRWGRAIWHRFMWEVGCAEVERDEARGKLEAVDEWSDKWPWSGLLGEAKRELDRILRGTKE